MKAFVGCETQYYRHRNIIAEIFHVFLHCILDLIRIRNGNTV